MPRLAVTALVLGAFVAPFGPAHAADAELVATGTGFIDVDGAVRSTTLTVCVDQDGLASGSAVYHRQPDPFPELLGCAPSAPPFVLWDR